MSRTYRTEFPDFTLDVDVSALTAAGFEDTSWHNDTCPSFSRYAAPGSSSDESHVRVYIEYSDAQRREMPDWPRFSVQQYDAEGCWIDGADLSTDDWSEAVQFALQVSSAPAAGV